MVGDENKDLPYFPKRYQSVYSRFHLLRLDLCRRFLIRASAAVLRATSVDSPVTAPPMWWYVLSESSLNMAGLPVLDFFYFLKVCS